MNLSGTAKTKTTTEIGQIAEQLALEFLQSKGLALIEKNFSCRHGEIDLIMKHEDFIVFVEVRYRKQSYFGSGAETVDYRKQQKLINSAQSYLQSHRKFSNSPARIDVVSISQHSKLTAPDIDWIPNAVHN